MLEGGKKDQLEKMSEEEMGSVGLWTGVHTEEK